MLDFDCRTIHVHVGARSVDKKLFRLLGEMMKTLEDLRLSIAKNADALASVKELVAGLRLEIIRGKNDPAALEELIDKLDHNNSDMTDLLAASVFEGTVAPAPAAPVAPVAPAVEQASEASAIPASAEAEAAAPAAAEATAEQQAS